MFSFTFTNASAELVDGLTAWCDTNQLEVTVTQVPSTPKAVEGASPSSTWTEVDVTFAFHNEDDATFFGERWAS